MGLPGDYFAICVISLPSLVLSLHCSPSFSFFYSVDSWWMSPKCGDNGVLLSRKREAMWFVVKVGLLTLYS